MSELFGQLCQRAHKGAANTENVQTHAFYRFWMNNRASVLITLSVPKHQGLFCAKASGNGDDLRTIPPTPTGFS